MSYIRVEIAGCASLMMNRFTEEAEEAVGRGTSRVQRGRNATPREQADRKAYKLPDGTLCVPAMNVYSCLTAGGRFHKLGKSKITTKTSSLFTACVQMMDVNCSLGTKDFEVDSRSVVIPATGGRIMAHRPRLDEWGLTFTLSVDDSMIDVGVVRDIVDDAGSKIGLGEWRPDRKGCFGRFKVTSWKVADTLEELDAAAPARKARK